MVASLSTSLAMSPMCSRSYISPATTCFPDRALLPSTPHDLWQIERGLARTYTWDQEGDITPLGIWGKGDIVGQSLSNLTPYIIQSLGSVEVRSLASDHLQNLEAILKHTHHLTTLLKIISIKRADDRLLSLLKWLAQRFGHATTVGTCTTIPMTHQELAEMANITRVTATRLIGDMEQQGILQWSRRRQFVLLPTP